MRRLLTTLVVSLAIAAPVWADQPTIYGLRTVTDSLGRLPYGGQFIYKIPAGGGDACTTTLADGNETTVSTGITNAAAGDVLCIPAGTWTWTSLLTQTKWLTIRGSTLCSTDGNGRANTCTTVIQDGITAANAFLWDLTCTASQTTRIHDLKFLSHTTRPDNDPGYYFKLTGSTTNGCQLRIDHNLFDCGPDCVSVPAKAPEPYYQYCSLGVFDHNTVNAGGVVGAGQQDGACWADGTNGDKSWSNSVTLGDGNAFYIEDNTFNQSNTIYGILTLVDCHDGGRFVFRYNIVNKGLIDGHGLEANRHRGCRRIEAYRNTWLGDDSTTNTCFIRGALGYIHDNGYYGYGATPTCSLINLRSGDHLTFAGGMDGKNPWDKNDDPNNPYTTATCGAGSSGTTCAGSGFATGHVGKQLRLTKGLSCGGDDTADLSRSGTTLTVTCQSHGLANNDIVSLWALPSNAQSYQSYYSVGNVATDTFDVTTFFTGAATATAKVRKGSSFGEILTNSSTQFIVRDSIYGSSYSVNFANGDTIEVNKVLHAMDGVGENGGSEVSGDNVDLPASWNNQTTFGMYETNNTKCSSSPPTVGCSGSNIDFGSGYGVLVSGTHFFNDTAPAGYSEYTYPHPLNH